MNRSMAAALTAALLLGSVGCRAIGPCRTGILGKGMLGARACKSCGGGCAEGSCTSAAGGCSDGSCGGGMLGARAPRSLFGAARTGGGLASRGGMAGGCADGSCGAGGGMMAGGRCGACGGAGCGHCGGNGILPGGQGLAGCHQQEGPAGPPTGAYAYPYYTLRAPRDFLQNNPPSIGPY